MINLKNGFKNLGYLQNIKDKLFFHIYIYNILYLILILVETMRRILNSINLSLALQSRFKSPNFLTRIACQPFSNPKKQKDSSTPRIKPLKTYSLQGIDESKIPQHLKEGYRIRKQTYNMQVPSEGEHQKSSIIAQINRQRLQNQLNTKSSQGINQNFVEKVAIATIATNLGMISMLNLPFFPNNAYWLGVYSVSLLYPSFICVTSISMGMNLAYLILRQGLCMHTKLQDLKNIDITKSPTSYYLEMGLLSLQLFSLATTVSLPLTLLELPINYRNVAFYTTLICILSVNAHSSYQQKDFSNPSFKMPIQSACFIVMVLLSAYIHIKFVDEDSKQGRSTDKDEISKKFKEGQRKMKELWKFRKIILQKDEKITDTIEKAKGHRQPKEEVANQNANKIWTKF